MFKIVLLTPPRFTGEGSLGGSTPAAAPSSAPAAPASAPSSAPAAAPSSAPSTSTPSGGSTPSASTPAGGSAPSAGAAAAAAPGGFNLRNKLSMLGLDASRYQDDDSAFLAIADHLRSQNQYAQIGQQVSPRMAQFQQWEAEQQKAAQAEAAKRQQSWWKAPEWNPSWNEAIDPQTGTVKPGYDPGILTKIQEFRRFQREAFDKFSQNPIEALKPGLEPMIKEMAQHLIQQQLGGYQDTQVAAKLIEVNSNWLYEQAPNNGGVKVNDQGQRILSPAGQVMTQHVQRLAQMGIKDSQQSWDLALELTKATLMQRAGAQQQAAPAAPAAAAPANPAVPAAPGTNRLQSLPAVADVDYRTIPKKDRPSLRNRMMSALAAKGITDLN